VDVANQKVYVNLNTYTNYTGQMAACTALKPHPHIVFDGYVVAYNTWDEHLRVSTARLLLAPWHQWHHGTAAPLLY
jgi:hypothetical protein